MAKKRIVLTFPPELVDQPIIYRLVKNYDLVLNILRAQVTPKEEGKMVLELEGDTEVINKGVKYLEDKKVGIQPLAKDIKLNDEECISCGACIAVCSPKALSMNTESWKLEFDRDRCLLCGLCLPACPLGVIQIEFE
ncbi:MAG: NIL domain-containing protein [bacterium]